MVAFTTDSGNAEAGTTAILRNRRLFGTRSTTFTSIRYGVDYVNGRKTGIGPVPGSMQVYERDRSPLIANHCQGQEKVDGVDCLPRVAA
jgi:hypothetical protein